MTHDGETSAVGESAVGERSAGTPLARWAPILTVLSIAGVAFAAYSMRSDFDGVESPSAVAIIGATAISVVAVMSGARAWSSLFPGFERAVLHASLYLSQLARYLPLGNVASAAGQIGLSSRAGATVKDASTRWVVAFLGAMAGASTTSVYLLAASGKRWLALPVLAAPVLVYRPLFGWAIGFLGRLWSPLAGATLPPQSDIVRSFGWSVLTAHLYGVAFWIYLDAFGASVSLWVAIAAYGVAWVAGAAVLPVPAGLGVRELALIAIAPAEPEVVLLVAVCHRASGLAAEVVLAVASWSYREVREEEGAG